VTLAGAVCCVVGWLVLDLACRKRTRDYRGLLSAAFGPRMTDLLDAVMTGLLLGTLAIMVAGASNIISRWTGLGTWLAGAMFCGTAALALKGGAVSLARLSRLLFPVILLSCLALTAAYLSGQGEIHFDLGRESWELMTAIPASAQAGGWGFLPRSWWLAALLYASYNTALFTSVFAGLGERVKSRATGLSAGLVAGSCLTVLLFTVVGALRLASGEAVSAAMPLLAIATGVSKYVGRCYSVILLLALFSATVANGYSLACRLGRWANWPISCAFSFGGSWVIGQVGFSELVGLVYPVFGWLWLAAIPCLLWEHARCTGEAISASLGKGFLARWLTDIRTRNGTGVNGGKRRW
jgi:uncharacterized membrane protein YkvI